MNGVEPGEKGTVVGDLEPGQYLMVCFVPGHDGVSHIDKKMIVPVEVVPGGEPVAEPAAEGEIVLEDYAIDIPEGFDGTGTFAVRNAGPADHELILMRYKHGKELADLVAWSDGGTKGTPPVTYTGGVGTIPRGETSWVDLDSSRALHRPLRDHRTDRPAARLDGDDRGVRDPLTPLPRRLSSPGPSVRTPRPGTGAAARAGAVAGCRPRRRRSRGRCRGRRPTRAIGVGPPSPGPAPAALLSCAAADSSSSPAAAAAGRGRVEAVGATLLQPLIELRGVRTPPRGPRRQRRQRPLGAGLPFELVGGHPEAVGQVGRTRMVEHDIVSHRVGGIDSIVELTVRESVGLSNDIKARATVGRLSLMSIRRR